LVTGAGRVKFQGRFLLSLFVGQSFEGLLADSGKVAAANRPVVLQGLGETAVDHLRHGLAVVVLASM
jgi:hypothetical protein